MEINHNGKYRLQKVVPVSSKKDPICANNIYLSSTKPTTFGRIVSDEVQVRFLSKSTPLMISRKHGTISMIDGKLTVTDHNSINGVYVCNQRIKPNIPHQLNVGEKVAFGCGVGNMAPEFEYVLGLVTPSSSKRIDIAKTQDDFISSPAKRKRVLDSPSVTIIESNAAQIKEQEDKIKKLTDNLLKKEVEQNELLNRLEESQKGLSEKLEQQKLQLEQERDQAENHLKDLLDTQLQEKELLLRTEFDEQIRFLQFEKNLVEKNLQEELSKKLSEKDQVYQKVLEQQKFALDQAMLAKENEKGILIAELQVKEGLIEKYRSVEENQRQLEDCLEELRKEIQEKEHQLQKQQEVTKKVELDAKQTVIQTMEDEFTCIICQELFIQATTLPCAHTFCELCLKLWMRKKKTCPVCRRRIKDKAVRSVVLDSAVEKMIESMDDGAKERRRELKQEREEQIRRDDATEDPDGIRNMIHHPDDDDVNDVQEQRNQPIEQRNRRDAYRRRSRSRSPRYHNHRQRPYHENRLHHENRYYQNDQNASGFHQNVNGNNDHFFHQQLENYNHARFYQERPGNVLHHNFVQNFQNNMIDQYGYNNTVRCFNCGGSDHVARFCPRR